MTHPANIVDRYRAAYTMSERGSTEGERTAARNAVAMMVKRYMGIHDQAFPPTPQAAPQAGPSTQQDGSVPWYERFAGFRNQAQEAFTWASRVAAEMASLEYARAAADELSEMQTKVITKERVQIAVKVPLRDLYYLGQRFSEAQKQEFAARISMQVEEEILRIMNEG